MADRARNPFIAALLSLLMPGLGHVYVGEARKGLLIFSLLVGIQLVFGLARLQASFQGFLVLWGAVGVLMVYAVVSAVRSAAQRKPFVRRRYNRWYWYPLFFVPMYAVLAVMAAARGEWFGFESFRIPAGSMHPTLQTGDLIAVDTDYADPQVGDIVVFRSPENGSIQYVKRIAALGGDQVSISDGQLLLDGVVAERLVVQPQYRQLDFSLSMPETHVPAHHAFMLGDARDNSKDSRFWGTVPVQNIIGKVSYIWYARDWSRIGQTPR